MTPALLGSIKGKKQGLLELVRDLPAEIHPLLNDINLGEALDVLRQIPDNSIDLIVTDPPYGYGFMGKQWDKALPDPRIWAECLRVLKPGGFVFVMASPRQDVLSRMIIALEVAGFETGFTSLYWTYAAGFPKAHNIGKAVEKKLGVKRMDGAYAGFQPKPAVEVILVVMKPLDRKGFTD